MEGFNSKLKQTEGRISKLEDRSFEIVESEDQEEKKNDEKWIEPEGFTGHHQKDQYIQL